MPYHQLSWCQREWSKTKTRSKIELWCKTSKETVHQVDAKLMLIMLLHGERTNAFSKTKKIKFSCTLIIHKPVSLPSFIVNLSHVFTIRRVLKERSMVHAVTGRARAVRIAGAIAGNGAVSSSSSMKCISESPVCLRFVHTSYQRDACSVKLSMWYSSAILLARVLTAYCIFPILHTRCGCISNKRNTSQFSSLNRDSREEISESRYGI